MFSLAAGPNEYLDVFMPIEHTAESMQTLHSATGICFLVALVFGMWLMSGMPGFPSNLSPKVHGRFATGFVVVLMLLVGASIVGGAVSVARSWTATAQSQEIRENMKKNVEKKYNAELLSPRNLPAVEERDESHVVSLIFKDAEDGKNSVSQTYNIRYDRATNEPFISKVDAPTAEELEEAAAK